MERIIRPLWGVDVGTALWGTEREKAVMRLQMIFLMGMIGEELGIRLEVEEDL